MNAALLRPGVDEIAAAVADVPALPASVTAVMHACDDVDVSVQEVARLVLDDQGLTANVLRLANSAAYGHRRRVATVSDAVAIMGTSAVKSLAISSHTAMLLDRELPGYAMRRGDLWRHSLAVAFVARALQSSGGPRAAEEAFVAGLLHDVGKLVLSRVLADDFDRITAIAHAGRTPLHDCERAHIGFDHAELGASIAAGWGLPDRLVEAIGLHHHPDRADVAPALAYRVAIADAVCNGLAAGVAPDDIPFLIALDALAFVALAADDIARVAADMAPAVLVDPLADEEHRAVR